MAIPKAVFSDRLQIREAKGLTVCWPSSTFSTIHCLEEKGRNIGLREKQQ